jgi:hypothetical protein
MKKIYIVLSIALVVTFACQPKPKTVSVNIEAEEAALSALFEKYYSTLVTKDVNSLAALLTEDALSCGTDPSEFWSKKEITDLWTQMIADTSLKINYSIDKREIRVAKDGKSALVVEQYIFPSLSTKIPVRSIYHVVKNNENWMLDFISWNFIPKNEDISRLNKSFE